MGVVNWGVNWGGGGGGGCGKRGGGSKKTRLKKLYNYYPWNSIGGSYENLIQRKFSFIRVLIKKTVK